MAHQGKQPLMRDRRGLLHVDKLEDSGWSLSVYLDLVIGVWMQGAHTDPREYTESGRDSRQVI